MSRVLGRTILRNPKMAGAFDMKDKNLPFKVQEKWLRSICERCTHAYEKNGCGGSSLFSDEYRRDCLYWSRKLRGKIEQCDTFDVAFRKAFEKMRSFYFYGPTVIAWEFAHYIMIALGWGLSEVEEEIIKKSNQKDHPLYFPGSPPCADDHLQKIEVGSAYGRTGYITWRGSLMRRKNL